METGIETDRQRDRVRDPRIMESRIWTTRKGPTKPEKDSFHIEMNFNEFPQALSVRPRMKYQQLLA